MARTDRIRGVIFDLDGTLVDTLGDVTAALSRALRIAERPPPSRESVRSWVGDGVERLVERALPDVAADLRGEVVRSLSTSLHEKPVGAARAFPGVDETLGALDRAGVTLAVLSNKPHPAAREVVRALFGDGLFSKVQGLEPGGPPKPDPRSVESLLGDIDLTAEQVLLVGDSEVDIEAGRAAGVRVAAATWGFRSRARLSSFDPYRLIDSPREILGLVGVEGE